MTTAIATGHSPKVSAPAGQHPWTGLTDEHFLELLANAPSRGAGGKPLRSHYAQNLLDVVHWCRRSSSGRGLRFRTTWEQLIIGRGADDRGERDANMIHGYRSAKRYLDALEEIGAIACEGKPGLGGGLWIELRRPAGLEFTLTATSPRSSAG